MIPSTLRPVLHISVQYQRPKYPPATLLQLLSNTTLLPSHNLSQPHCIYYFGTNEALGLADPTDIDLPFALCGTLPFLDSSLLAANHQRNRFDLDGQISGLVYTGLYCEFHQ